MRSRHRWTGLPAFLLPVALLLSPVDATAAECRYDIVVSDAMASELDVTIECDGGLPNSFAMFEGAPAWAGPMDLSIGGSAEQNDTRWIVPAGSRNGTAHYTLALRAMVEANIRHSTAQGVGRSIIAEPYTWLAIPEPAVGRTISIRFDTANGGSVATAMPRDGDRYSIAASVVPLAGPTVFGTFEHMAVEMPAPGALATASDATTAIDLVMFGPPMTSSTDELADWVQRSGQVVAQFWAGFPAERALLLLIPVEGEEVTFGRVDASGGLTIQLHVGRDAELFGLYQDWVLIHEMLHLGSPYMRDTGAWLNEGIATFYEPIVRMRAGWKTRDDVWREWIEWMPNGLRAMGEVGLADAEGGGVYWGGALFLLLAEIEVRGPTNLALGVENCLRAVRDAGGTADIEWTTREFLDFCDETLSGTTMRDLAARHLGPGEPPDLDALWAQLGVSMAEDGTIAYDDSAPLAAVREAVLSGGPNAKWQRVPLRTE